jgi:MSHA pilin protein MshA
MNNQKGFTLIELVVVIVILGILSAVAVPKFMGMQDESHLAKTKSARGAFKTAISLAHAKSLASGNGTGATAENITLPDKTTVSMTNSWPTSPEDAKGCVTLFNKIMDDDIEAYTGTASGTDYLLTTFDNDNGACTFTEQESSKKYQFSYTVGGGKVSQVAAQ